MKVRFGVSALAFLSMIVSACSPSGLGSSASPPSEESRRAIERTLVLTTSSQPVTLLGRGLNVAAVGSTPNLPPQLFHAALALYDDQSLPQPQLAETLPQLGTDSWKVFPDGRMETTWRLRPNLTWHDGAPLVADDVAFSIPVRVALKTPGDTGGAKLGPLIDEVTAPDARTVVVRWSKPFPLAGESEWQPLPRHILGPFFEQMPPETFANLPYFSTEFVGAGPYRLGRWEPGAFIEGVAFPGYVNGKPKIERVNLVWISDSNTAVAQLLSGTVHLATDGVIAFEQATVLKREWAARGEAGFLLSVAAAIPSARTQFKTEYTNPTAILDVRVRQAIAHAIDKQAIVDGVLDGDPRSIADSLVLPHEPFFQEVDKVVTKYPLDLRRTEQLMAEAGFRKDDAGFYSQNGIRLNTSIQGVAGARERAALIVSDSWKNAGIEAPPRIISVAQSAGGELETTFPAFAIDIGTGTPLGRFNKDQIATAATRWSGGNKSGYSDPEYERLHPIFTGALDRNERNQAAVQMMKLLSDQAAVFPLYYNSQIVAHAGSLVGPRSGKDHQAAFKIEEWYWQQ